MRAVPTAGSLSSGLQGGSCGSRCGQPSETRGRERERCFLSSRPGHESCAPILHMPLPAKTEHGVGGESTRLSRSQNPTPELTCSARFSPTPCESDCSGAYNLESPLKKQSKKTLLLFLLAKLLQQEVLGAAASFEV